MEFANENFLVRIGIADAWASANKFLTGTEYWQIVNELLNLERYISNPKHSAKPGCYSDVTEMSVAIANALIENDLPIEPVDYAQSFIDSFWFGKCRPGYSAGFYDFLWQVKDGEEFLQKIKPGSIKNGATMRAVPLGVIPNIDDLLCEVETQAKTTHNTLEGIFSAQVVALASHFAFYESDSFDNLAEYCLDILMDKKTERFRYIFEESWPAPAVGRKKITKYPGQTLAITTVHAVIDLLKNQKSFLDILRQTILWGGDTDSVAAIAGGIFSINNPGEKLPEFMTRDLEQGSPRTGAFYLQEVGKKLINKFK